MQESIVESDCTRSFSCPIRVDIEIFGSTITKDAYDLAVHLTPEPRNLLFRKNKDGSVQLLAQFIPQNPKAYFSVQTM